MKKIITTVQLCALFFGWALAEDVIENPVKKIKIRFIVQNSAPQELRKFSTSTLLQGMANSCNQLGKVAGATDKKEKQKETCNLIASFLQLAADVSKESAGNPKNKDKNDNNINETNQQKETSEEKKVITDQTISLILRLVNFLNDDEEKDILRSEPSVYLSMLKDLPNDDAREEIIEQILTDKKEREGFLEEIINTLKKVLFVSIPEMAANLLDSLNGFFN